MRAKRMQAGCGEKEASKRGELALNSHRIKAEFPGNQDRAPKAVQTVRLFHSPDKFQTPMSSYRKSELAGLAGVSYSTFYRFLQSRQRQLSRLGCPSRSRIVRGKALEYICREYGITLPEEPEKAGRMHETFR